LIRGALSACFTLFCWVLSTVLRGQPINLLNNFLGGKQGILSWMGFVSNYNTENVHGPWRVDTVYVESHGLVPTQPLYYINEDLTRMSTKIFYHERKLLKNKKIEHLWTTNGKIIMKGENYYEGRKWYDKWNKYTRSLPYSCRSTGAHISASGWLLIIWLVLLTVLLQFLNKLI
jgi:hypothetical protein